MRPGSTSGGKRRCTAKERVPPKACGWAFAVMAQSPWDLWDAVWDSLRAPHPSPLRVRAAARAVGSLALPPCPECQLSTALRPEKPPGAESCLCLRGESISTCEWEGTEEGMAGCAAQASDFVHGHFASVRSAIISIEIHYLCGNYHGLLGAPVPRERSWPVELGSFLIKRMLFLFFIFIIVTQNKI